MPEISLAALRSLLPQMRGANFGVAGPQELADMPLSGLDRAVQYALPFSAQAQAPRSEDVAYRTPYFDITEGDIGRATDVGMGTSGGGLSTKGIRAYHGSPHDFDRFDLSKIGTGEGAQAYGHGLYFAESEGVAKSYRDALAPQLARDPAYWADKNLPKALTPPENNQLTILGAEMRAQGNLPAEKMQVWRELYDRKRTRDDAIEAMKPKGSMYEVNINADPAHFLDWDKPLSQQSSSVKSLGISGERPIAYGDFRTEFLNPMHEAIAGKDFARFVRPDDFYKADGVNMDAVRHALASDPATLAKIEGLQKQYAARSELRGSDVYHTMARSYETDIGGLTGAPRTIEASEMMREAGIPGIKYLDQGSRSKAYTVQPTYKGEPYGEPVHFDHTHPAERWAQEQRDKGFGAEVKDTGSRNYVVFNDKLIDIMRKYGLAGLAPLAGYGAMQQGQQPSPQM